MKTILPLLFSFLLLISCSNSEKVDYNTPKKVIIAGQVLNINPDNLNVRLYVNRPGIGQKEIYAETDSSGKFHASTELYTPTDVWVDYKTNFLVLVHPGDSIYVEFDGEPDSRPAILKKIKFSGNKAKKNQDAAQFQYMYFSNPLYYDKKEKEEAAKNFNINRYVLYLSNLQQKIDSLYDAFVNRTSPDDEVKIWARTYIEQDYYDALYYPGRYPGFVISENYSDSLLRRLPITKDMFISGFALINFVNRFHYNYCFGSNKIWDTGTIEKYKNEEGQILVPPNVMDSLYIYSIIKNTPDTLLRQMILTEHFQQNLEMSKIELYEKYKPLIDEYIKEPFLSEPLHETYKMVNERIENPKLATDAYLKKLENTFAKQIFDTIMHQNKGKVIYLDCWATWCGPCKAEMPHSKELMEKLKDKDVAFVYVCVDSEEDLWKASLAEFQLGGQHYHLSQQQSKDWREVFEVNGIPHYFLIDKNGVIVEKGSHLRPNITLEKIERLL